MESSYINQSNFPFNSFQTMSLTYDKCFLCGENLIGKKSEEHVFPKWIQKEFDLWNQRIALLNRTEITYKKLRIPCCKRCNNEHLSKLEEIIRSTYKKGYKAFYELEEITVFHWISKIYYGLLFKELSLPKNRRNPNLEKIITPDALKQFMALHIFLQSIRKKPINFIKFNPWSIFIFKMHTYGNYTDFDYHDDLIDNTFSMQLGEIGIVACLGDNGVIKRRLNKDFLKLKDVPLHPIQFKEFSALVKYYSYLINHSSNYISLSTEGSDTLNFLPPSTIFGGSVFNQFNHSDYAVILFQYWRRWNIKLEDVYDKNSDGTRTYLKDEIGQICVLDKAGNILHKI